MSKEQKNYSDYAFMGDETISMSVEQFEALDRGLNQAMKQAMTSRYPQVIRWYSKKTGDVVQNPTKSQIMNKEVEQKGDPDSTFHPENIQTSFSAESPDIFQARRVLMAVFANMVDTGVAKPIEDVKKAYAERNGKGQMKVEEDEVSEPKASMKVVKDDEPEENKE